MNGRTLVSDCNFRSSQYQICNFPFSVCSKVLWCLGLAIGIILLITCTKVTITLLVFEVEKSAGHIWTREAETRPAIHNTRLLRWTLARKPYMIGKPNTIANPRHASINTLLTIHCFTLGLIFIKACTSCAQCIYHVYITTSWSLLIICTRESK